MTVKRFGELFKAETLVECLIKVGVKAFVEGNEIHYDKEKLETVSFATMPHFLFMNYKWLTSRY